MLELKFLFGTTPGIFLGQDIHFAVYLFAALACFAAGWLYFDAWTGRRHLIELFKWVGFFLLAVGFLVTGAVWDAGGILDATSGTLKLLGYVGLIIGNILDPLQPIPKISDDSPSHDDKKSAAPQSAPTKITVSPSITPSPSPSTPARPVPSSTVTPTAIQANPTSTPNPSTNPGVTPPKTTPAIAPLFAFAQGASYALPIAAFLIAGLYWRRATTGLERHLKPIAGVFLALALADSFALAKLWRTSDNPVVQSIVQPLGPFWIAEHVALLAGGAWLMWWVWRYLTKRFLTQLFLTMTTFTVTIVLVATISITSLLLTSLQKDSLASLETAAKVLNYAISSKTAETRSNAIVLSQNPAVATAATASDHTNLSRVATDLLVKQKLSDVIVTDDAGQVLTRASDPDRYGDSLSDDSLIRRALIGNTASTTTTRNGVLAPELVITTASPIRASERIVGVAVVSLALDNSFVDGIKQTTGLDSAVYAGNTRTATTLVAPDGTSRSVGAKETSQNVLDTTIKQGKTWHGSLGVSNQTYLAVYLPLKDVDNTVVGMLFVGQPQDTLMQSAGAAIKLTFASAVVWLLLIMFPIYLVSKLINRQLR